MSAARLVIAPDGGAHMIHDDEAFEIVGSLGPARIRRASHVEPTDDARWTADMGPSGGPVLGPFATRSEALDAEAVWLREHVIGGHDGRKQG